MKTCLLFGHNGLDFDVTLNLRSFYKKLGFWVFYSDKLYDADLLVVLRAVDCEIDISAFHYSLIHVFDYGGWNYDGFIRTINHQQTFIFSTSEDRKISLVKKFNFPKKHVFIAFPPVSVDLWSKKLKKIKYQMVHIGNLKKITVGDTFKELFNNAISHFRAHIWGLGWEVNKNLYHGKAGLFQVSSIYSKSKFALGLMYPFQRNVTFSGRFWHAPLNGCMLLSEPGLFTRMIPGVIETDYSIEDIQHKIKKDFDRYVLREESKEFWECQYKITMGYALSTLSNLIVNKRSVKTFINHHYLSLFNFAREFYQKLRLFNLVKRKG